MLQDESDEDDLFDLCQTAVRKQPDFVPDCRANECAISRAGGTPWWLLNLRPGFGPGPWNEMTPASREAGGRNLPKIHYLTGAALMRKLRTASTSGPRSVTSHRPGHLADSDDRASGCSAISKLG